MRDPVFLVAIYIGGVIVAAWQAPLAEILGSASEPGSLTVTSFNTAGVADKWNETRTSWYHSLLSQGDVVALQEVRGSPAEFKQRVEASLPYNHSVVVSSAMGRTQYYKERYVFVFNESAVSVQGAFILDEVNEAVNRPPYVLNISHRNQSFLVANAHTDPERANIETMALTAALSGEDVPVVVAGDLNADCSYGGPKGINDAFTPFISADADTTTGKTDCAYDRILGDEGATARQQTRRVGDALPWISDHHPVKASFAAVS